FLVCECASQEMYASVRENHNEFFPDTQRLSYEQVQNCVKEWSGIEPIIHDMCPNLCMTYMMAYMGSYSTLEECPYKDCGESRWDTFQLKMSQGKIKVSAQRFSTMLIGPQIQALLRVPESMLLLKYRCKKTAEILEIRMVESTWTL
ncbi:hypothetical protein K439DRAFT_1334032, partial [Ramaria rubella]